jgi:hypothetical protein
VYYPDVLGGHLVRRLLSGATWMRALLTCWRGIWENAREQGAPEEVGSSQVPHLAAAPRQRCQVLRLRGTGSKPPHQLPAGEQAASSALG